jgi:signal transduction histidine kinase
VIDAIRNEDGALLGFAKVTRDVTERVETQQALEGAREALFQSQKIEAIGQLTGGIAHDFNNLLMAVLGSLELVRKRLAPDPRITPLIDNAIQGAERGAILTQRMLSFARKQDLTFVAVDVPSLVEGMSEFIERSIGPNVEVSPRFSPGLPRVHTDPYQLEAALLNLVVNARDAMPQGGTITITAEPEACVGSMTGAAGEAAFVRISVQDTGEGMDEATLQRATEPFFTTKGTGKGTGLGLSMVHGLAEQSGGRFGMTSREGEGSAAHIWLPVARAGEATGVATSAPAEAPDRRGLRILVVDDDRLVLTNTVAMLEDLGHSVIAAESAKEGLETARRDADIDLVITDEVMPKMSGSQMAGRMLETRPGLPIGVVTGYADLADQGHRLNLDLPRLAKPFTQEALAVFVDQLMAAERAPA